MGRASGFEYVQRKDGSVVIHHEGRHATTLRGPRAADFLTRAAGEQDQELMARVTGNPKRGNEREGRRRSR